MDIIETLNNEQKIAYLDMFSGSNVFLSGYAGTGKSYLIDVFYKKAYLKHGSKIFKTSTTGISAKLIGGMTLHSFAGIGLGTDSVEKLVLNMNFNARKRILGCKILIIDECSMLSFELFNKLNELFKVVRRNNDPFGSIQMILVGDFLQLPPVKDENFCFESEAWLQCKFKVHILKEIIRQKDPVFQKILNEIRIGVCSEETSEILKKYIKKDISNEQGILGTRIFPVNKSVEIINNQELKKLLDSGAKSKTYSARYKTVFNRTSQSGETLIANINKDNIIPEKITLCIGAQVIFKKNIKDTNIVNGTRAVVSDFLPEVNSLFKTEYPLVTLLDNTKYLVVPEIFSFESENLYSIQRIVLPLKLAWASSIHNMQGSTIDLAIIDAGNDIFEFGQIYVALSRVKSLEGLSLSSFEEDKIFANPKVLEFYKNYE